MRGIPTNDSFSAHSQKFSLPYPFHKSINREAIYLVDPSLLARILHGSMKTVISIRSVSPTMSDGTMLALDAFPMHEIGELIKLDIATPRG